MTWREIEKNTELERKKGGKNLNDSRVVYWDNFLQIR